MVNRRQSEPYIATYLHSKGRRLGLPIAGNFELTARCNFNCPMCYVHLNEQQIQNTGKEMTKDEILSLAKEARDMGMVFCLLTGGEPLVRKDFFEIYDGLKKLGLFISINTNGSLLTGDILNRFLQDPPFRFNISLYGGSDDTYRKMCGLPMYNTVKDNIRKLTEHGIDVTINLSITPYNCTDIERIYNDALELGVNIKATTYMFPSIRVDKDYGEGNRFNEDKSAYYAMKWDRIRFDNNEFIKRAKALSDMMIEHDGCPIEEGEGVKCRAGSSSFWLTWDGRMLPCGMMETPVVYPLKEGFKSAWQKLIKETKQIKTPSQCEQCSYKEVCSVCASACYCETGEFNKVPEFLCEKTKRQVEYMREEAERIVYEDKEGTD